MTPPLDIFPKATSRTTVNGVWHAQFEDGSESYRWMDILWLVECVCGVNGASKVVKTRIRNVPSSSPQREQPPIAPSTLSTAPAVLRGIFFASLPNPTRVVPLFLLSTIGV